jgi:threonine/homoserine/homoserine lactone efflux protein
MSATQSNQTSILRHADELAEGFGTGYLCEMGLLLLRATISATSSAVEVTRSPVNYFRQAFAVSVTNPKVILFFVAFFPLFIQPQASALTLAVMMAHVTVLSLLYQAGLVLIGNVVAARLKAIPSTRKIANCLAGFALIGFGIKLAINNR